MPQNESKVLTVRACQDREKVASFPGFPFSLFSLLQCRTERRVQLEDTKKELKTQKKKETCQIINERGRIAHV